MASIFLHRHNLSRSVVNRLPVRFSSSAASVRIADQDWTGEGGLDSSWKSTNQSWRHIDDESLTNQSLSDLLRNKIPAIRVQQFLSRQECQRMADVVATYKIVRYPLLSRFCLLFLNNPESPSGLTLMRVWLTQGSYNNDVFPPIGSVGITQFDFKQSTLSSSPVYTASSVGNRGV